jgi:hypothetical protein
MHSLVHRFLYTALVASAALTVNAVGALSASVENENIVSSQMLKCLKLPANAPSAYDMQAVAILKNGSADFVSINFRTMPSEWEKTAAPAIGEAITDCEPYGSISGKFEFAVTPELVGPAAKN